ncbi:2-C-methyl-D-erythritol 4-phosphate cytidylyltransferase [Roseivivax marinus]|uniref:2-C-methyl-D-erythritol 4-phosphate cytidylyltransferase n=1 Tax=Roseivivax marinus TaxID=1379903 RepID=W4HP12_9RHOB|nr:2-C-methyl-D-erythritol 4-phosphate cytidylyltransferase [Roseivivax marinus]ETW14414.1 2-C-methyl-D-erythritol 4-phosphate cytidylyltransferase [Roseivivax marinus]
MRQAALIVAAGRGTRAGGDLPKQWRPVAGRTVTEWTLSRFSHMDEIALVIHPDDRAAAAEAIGALPVRLIAGGADRAASVRAGLEALTAAAPDVVLIHDVARPCVPRAVIDRVVAALETVPGAAPGLPVTDALWQATPEGRVGGTARREGLFRAQTPQGFRFRAILDAHLVHPGGAADDVEVARMAGIDVAIVAGAEDNLKITGPDDFDRAARILETMDGHTLRQRI